MIMGWDGCADWKSKADVIADWVRTLNVGATLVDQKNTKDGAWMLVQDADGYRAIVLLLIEKHSGTWMRKEIGEEMGPCYYDCPLSFFENTPVTCATWRQLVRERRARLNPGL